MLIFFCALLFAGIRALLLLRNSGPRRMGYWLGWGLVALSVAVAGVMAAQELTIQKLLGRLVMPLGLMWLALWICAGTAWYQGLRRWGLGLSALALAFTLAGNPLLARWLMIGLEARVEDLAFTKTEPFEAIFLLGGGTQCSITGVPNLAYHGDRVAVAAQLYHGALTSTLVVSGSGLVGFDDGRDLAAETAYILQGLGVPAQAIEQLPGPRTTSEELAAYHALIGQKQWRRVGLISSAWHLPRALQSAHRLGLHIIPIPAGRHGPGLPWTPVFLIPTGEAAYEIHNVVWEYVGMAVGR